MSSDKKIQQNENKNRIMGDNLINVVNGVNLTSQSEIIIKFIRYVPSELESEWFKHKYCLNPCDNIIKLNNIIDILSYGKFIEHPELFSKFVYHINGHEFWDYIEPLVGISRSQKFCIDDSHVMDMDYLVLSQVKNIKCNIIDLGAIPHSGSKWLLDNIMCEIEHIHGFEIANISASTVFNLIPVHLRSKYHWWNLAANDDFFETYDLNTNMIIFKLDIDQEDLETHFMDKFIETFSSKPNMIKEFFYEHHVTTKEMDSYWGVRKGTHCDSEDLFLRLRNSGIRSHHWI